MSTATAPRLPRQPCHAAMPLRRSSAAVSKRASVQVYAGARPGMSIDIPN
jgi:hypothetical protein